MLGACRAAFFRAAIVGPDAFDGGQASIRRQSNVEREARDMKLDLKARKALRQATSRPILADIIACWSGNSRRAQRVRPSHRRDRPRMFVSGTAITASLRSMTKLPSAACVESPSEDGDRLSWEGTWAAGWQGLTGITATCKRLGVPPFQYLRDLFQRTSTHPHNNADDRPS